MHRDFSLPARGPYNIRTINPSDRRSEWGSGNVAAMHQLRITFFDGSNNVIEQVVSASGIRFFGIVNSLGAARVESRFRGAERATPRWTTSRPPSGARSYPESPSRSLEPWHSS